MKRPRFLILSFLVCIFSLSILPCHDTARAQPLVPYWSWRFGDSDLQRATDIAADPAGSLVLVGVLRGTVDFGGGPLTSAGSGDVFLVKFGPNGFQTWSKRFGDAGPQGANQVAVDSGGNIVVAGSFGGELDFGGGPLTSQDGATFLAKFDPNGQHLWSKQFGVSNVSEGGVEFDATGNVFMAGAFSGTVDFGGGPLTSTGYNVFLAKFDASGNHLWSKRFGTAQALWSALAVDPFGNAVLSGAYYGAIDFGGGPFPFVDNFDGFVAKFDPNGTYVWSKSYGDHNSSAIGRVVAVDALSNVFFAGSLQGTVDLGGGALTSSGNSDIVLAKLNADGTHIWSKRFGNAEAQAFASVATDGAGNVIITGPLYGTVDFGGGALVSSSSHNPYLAKFNSAGTHVWSGVFPGNGNIGSVVTTDVSGNVLLAGGFNGVVNFGHGAMASVGDYDIFVAKFGEPPVATAIMSFIARESSGGVTLRARVRSDLGIKSVRVYRGSSRHEDQLVLIDTERDVRDNTFEYVDRTPSPGQTYRYRIGVIDADGEFLSPIETVSLKTVAAGLAQNFPNPFNPQTTISYTVSERALVAIEIFDASGMLVRRLDQGVRDPGSYGVEWDGRDAANQSVGSGVYFYRLAGMKGAETRKMVLVK